MQVANRNAINAYSQVGVETSVAFASPHQLILMLYDGALVAIANARLHMLDKQLVPKAAALSKAVAIIDEGLKACLEEEAGGEIAKNLKSLYEYMCSRLIRANLKNEVEPLDEVTRLLSELKGAWEAIGTKTAPMQPAPTHLQQRAAISYGKA